MDLKALKSALGLDTREEQKAPEAVTELDPDLLALISGGRGGGGFVRADWRKSI